MPLKWKASDVLKEARLYVRDRRFEFVCHAVGNVARTGADLKAVRRVTDRVAMLLRPHFTLDSWLREHHREVTKVSPSEYFKKTRLTRLAWIDDMTKYFKQRGD